MRVAPDNPATAGAVRGKAYKMFLGGRVRKRAGENSKLTYKSKLYHFLI